MDLYYDSHRQTKGKPMPEDKKQETKKPKKADTTIKGLDIDKAEYEQIVLSNSNFPDRDYYKRNYRD